MGKKKESNVLYAGSGTDGEDRKFFKCAQSGFLCKERVFFPADLLRSTKCLTLLGNCSFLDWNNAVVYIERLHKEKRIEDEHMYKLHKYVADISQISITDPIMHPPEGPNYPADINGHGPKSYIQCYEDERMTNGSQTVEEYENSIMNNNVPKVQTEEDKKKAFERLRLLKKKNNLNFTEVRIKASDLEITAEDQRVKPLEQKEKELLAAEPDPATGKRKALSKEEQSAKKRKIASDGTKKLEWMAGESRSADILEGLFNGRKGKMDFAIQEVDDKTHLNLSTASGKNVSLIMKRNL